MQNTLGFDSITDDSKEYFVQVFSEPSLYNMNLKIYENGIEDNDSWVSIRKDGLGYGFYVSVVKDNYSRSGDTAERREIISGYLETCEDIEYDGTARRDVLIECVQGEYKYEHIKEDVNVYFKAVQAEDKSLWHVTWNTDGASIPQGCYDVEFSDGRVVESFEIIGKNGEFDVYLRPNSIEMYTLLNQGWTIFTGAEYTEYKCKEPVLTLTQSEDKISIELEKTILEYNETQIKVSIKSNTEWICTAYENNRPENKQVFSGYTDGEKILDTIVSGENRTGRNIEYVVVAKTKSPIPTVVTDYFKKKYYVESSIQITSGPLELSPEGTEIIKITAVDANCVKTIMSLQAIPSTGDISFTSDSYSKKSAIPVNYMEFNENGDVTEVIKANPNISKNSPSVLLNIIATDLNGEETKETFIVSQRHHDINIFESEMEISSDGGTLTLEVSATTNFNIDTYSEELTVELVKDDGSNHGFIYVTVPPSILSHEVNYEISVCCNGIFSDIKDSIKITQEKYCSKSISGTFTAYCPNGSKYTHSSEIRHEIVVTLIDTVTSEVFINKAVEQGKIVLDSDILGGQESHPYPIAFNGDFVDGRTYKLEATKPTSNTYSFGYPEYYSQEFIYNEGNTFLPSLNEDGNNTIRMKITKNEGGDGRVDETPYVLEVERNGYTYDINGSSNVRQADEDPESLVWSYQTDNRLSALMIHITNIQGLTYTGMGSRNGIARITSDINGGFTIILEGGDDTVYFTRT